MYSTLLCHILCLLIRYGIPIYSNTIELSITVGKGFDSQNLMIVNCEFSRAHNPYILHSENFRGAQLFCGSNFCGS